MNFRHEYDARGNHRLVNRDTEKAGEWVSYQTPATYPISKSESYVVCSEYYEGSREFPKHDWLYKVVDTHDAPTVGIDVPREQ